MYDTTHPNPIGPARPQRRRGKGKMMLPVSRTLPMTDVLPNHATHDSCPSARTIILNAPVRDIAEFRQLALLARRLTPHGRVELNISTLAQKAVHTIPPGGSPWHEYASCNPTPACFFPDEALAPFIPASFVAANRAMLLAKAEVLRELDLGAAFWSYEPNHLPEAFFERYPDLRGPRGDHPRRSRHEAFAPCVDQPQVLAMTRRMVGELVRHVPELGTYFFKTNDAGPALCWSHGLYSGANGPESCHHQAMGKRVGGLVQSIQQGARDAGGAMTVHFTGHFSSGELHSITDHLPPDSYIREGGKGSISLSSGIDSCYPVRGIFDLLGALLALSSPKSRATPTMFLDLRAHYDRAHEQMGTCEKMLEVVSAALSEPPTGTLGAYELARRLCDGWVGLERGEALFEAMAALHEALKYKRAALPRVSAIYGGVSLRYITRPLMLMPQRLSAAEEAYFLPHLFNVSLEQARLDYLDVHGARLQPEWMSMDSDDPRVWAISTARDRFDGVAARLDALGDDPDVGYWRQMAASLRLYGCILQSCGNFHAMQIIRDRSGKKLRAHGPLRPTRTGEGESDFALVNDILRDELDNTARTIGLLKRAGLEIISHATDPADEDTFLLGPNILDQLERKRALMRAHWLDAHDCFVSPNR